MKYYKQLHKNFASQDFFTEYFAVPHDKIEVAADTLKVTLRWPGIYWVEHLAVFISETFEPIDQKEFDYEYQRALETFNSFLNPESDA